MSDIEAEIAKKKSMFVYNVSFTFSFMSVIWSSVVGMVNEFVIASLG